MAGETIKTEAICMDIRPWSRTSHVVSWLTPTGKVATVVKGAVRAKSPFLGQYDLNYTCDIVYYARAKGELHALRECVPMELREELRSDYRALALAGYMRSLVAELAPMGEECRAWYEELERGLSCLVPCASCLVRFELEVLNLSGLAPDFSKFDRSKAWMSFSLEDGAFGSDEGRCMRVSREVAEYLARLQCGGETPPPQGGFRGGAVSVPRNLQTPLDAARVIGVFYQFHLDCASDVRRTVLEMISNQEGQR